MANNLEAAIDEVASLLSSMRLGAYKIKSVLPTCHSNYVNFTILTETGMEAHLRWFVSSLPTVDTAEKGYVTIPVETLRELARESKHSLVMGRTSGTVSLITNQDDCSEILELEVHKTPRRKKVDKCQPQMK